MAKFRATAFPAAALLLCFFTVAIARSTPSSDDSAATSQLALPLRLSSPDSAEKLSSPDPAALRLSSPDPALRLPSESDAKLNTESDPSSAVVTAVPLTEITFRPINRRFNVRSKRPCRQHFKFYPTMRGNQEISYGNDMLLSAGENSDFEQPMVHGGGKRIPGRWMRMHHHHRLRRRRDEDTDSDSDSDSEEEDHTRRSVFKRYDYDRFDREKRLNKLRHHFRARVEEAEKKKRSGFMFRVRKFLDHYI